MNNANREKILLITALVAIVILFGDKFVLGPLLASWDDRAYRIEELDNVTRFSTGVGVNSHAL